MSLTVPTAGVSGGRAAQLQFETPQTGNVIAAFGDAVKGIGDQIEGERLDLEMGRLQVDMTRDLGNLRLKYENMGDPEAINAGWGKDLATLKDSYLNGQTETGRARVDPKLRDRWSLGFDDLAEKHAFAIGTNVMAIQRSQRVATGIEYAAVAAQQAATVDASTRDTIYAQYDERVDGEVKAGLKTPEAGAKEKLDFRANGDANAAFQMLQDDPHGLLDHLDAGELANLTPEDRAGYAAKATAELDRRAKAAAQDAASAAKEQVAGWKADIQDGLGVISTGKLWGNAALLDNPAVAAALPNEVAHARGALAFQGEAKNINRMSLDELRAEAANLAGQPATKKWQTEKSVYLDARIADVEKATGTDPVGFWQASMPEALPPLDLSSPEAAAKSLAGRIARADHLTQTGHLPKGAYLSAADTAALKPMIADTADANTRLAWASSLTAGGADHAIPLAKAAGATPVFQQALMLLSDGVDPATVMPMLRGEQKLATNVASAPPPKDQQALFNELTGDVFAGDPGAASRVMAGASAIYADDMGTISPDDIANGVFSDGPARDKMLRAVQSSLGASPDANGDLTIGGVQDIRGRKLALPRGVAASAVEATIDRIGLQLNGLSPTTETEKFSPTLAPNPAMDAVAKAAAPAPLPKDDIYRGLKDASLTPGQYPDLGANGADPAEMWNNIRIEPAGQIGQDAYLLVRTTDRGIDRIMTDPTGHEYYFSLSKLVGTTPRSMIR